MPRLHSQTAPEPSLTPSSSSTPREILRHMLQMVKTRYEDKYQGVLEPSLEKLEQKIMETMRQEVLELFAQGQETQLSK